jgi:hypothetical protein
LRNIVRANPSLRITLVVNKSSSAVAAPPLINDTDMPLPHTQLRGLTSCKLAGKPPFRSSEFTKGAKKCRKIVGRVSGAFLSEKWAGTLDLFFNDNI